MIMATNKFPIKMNIPVKSESVRVRISEPTSADSSGLSNLQLATMAIAAAVTVGNLYYCQPLLSQIARSLHMTARETADIPMLTQVGYALGLLFFAPLGDMVERRGLATALLLIVTVSLVATASAPDAWVLLATSLITGMFTVVPQVMAPMASVLSKPGAQGRAVGIVMGGMFIGILVARTVAGFVGTWFGWRVMYAGAAVMMVAMAALLGAVLPVSRPDARIRYRELLSSLIPLARKLPALRQAAIMSGFAFGAFSAYWTTLIFFLEKPPYHYGAQMAGLLGLVGVAGDDRVWLAVGRRTNDSWSRHRRHCSGPRHAGQSGHQSDARPQVDPGGTQPNQHSLHGHVLCRRRARHLPGRLCVEPLAMDRRVRVGCFVLRRRANRMGCRKLGGGGRRAGAPEIRPVT